MKKIVSLVLVLLLVFLFSSCNKEAPGENSSLPSGSESSVDESSETDDSEFLKQTDTVTWSVEIPECFSEYREGVVRYSNIDPESSLARAAVEFAMKYLEKTFSENPEIESYEITSVEIDISQTNWYINEYYY
ncbi:MAG: hypothetical protein IJ306_00330, partial [Oscillospiraceae bacterium]|nr:hypothetical protein [Oscillospiraceae bacterium]